MACPADASSNNFEVHCEEVEQSEPRSRRLVFDLGSDGFNIPEGTWDIVFSHRKQEIHRIKSLEAEAGIENHDPRMLKLEWESFLAAVVVRVQAPDGGPAHRATMWVGAGPHHRTGMSVVDGRLVCVGPRSDINLSVEWEDGSMVELGVVSADQVVRRGCGPVLCVEFDHAPELPDGVTLVAAAGDAEQAIGSDGTGEFCVPAPGHYKVELFAVRGERRAQVPIELDEFDVPVGGSRIPVESGRAFKVAMAKAIQSLRQDNPPKVVEAAYN